MKLYYSPGACSLAVHIALREAGITFELAKVDLATHTLEDRSDFYDVNPKGAVPALDLGDGRVLTEAAAVLLYVADQAPARNLAPEAGTFERSRLHEVLNQLATEVHKSWYARFSPNIDEVSKAVFKERLQQQYRLLNRVLSRQPWILGEHYSVADTYLFVTLSWQKFLPLDLTGLANLESFVTRMSARPAVQAAMAAEGLN